MDLVENQHFVNFKTNIDMLDLILSDMIWQKIDEILF